MPLQILCNFWARMQPHWNNQTGQRLGSYRAFWKKPTPSPTTKTSRQLTPFAEGRKLVVDIPINPQGTTDAYIDDIISLMVGIEGTDILIWWDHAPLLAFDTCALPLHSKEPIPWETIEAINKLQSEALLKEQKTILGWFIDFCWLLIMLPTNKFVAWTKAIKKMINDESTTAKNWKQT